MKIISNARQHCKTPEEGVTSGGMTAGVVE